MAEVLRPDGARIHYEVRGSGYPVLLLAPGGVSSETRSWARNFYDPWAELAEHFTVIAMDQRHAGRSPAPPVPYSYEQTAGDQLAVLDAVGVESAHLVGADIGCAHAWRLTQDAPARVTSVVAQQPVGLDGTNTLGSFFRMFDEAMRVVRAASFDDPVTGGLTAAVEAARTNGRFADNPAGGPFAQRLHDDPEFAKEIIDLRRESYVTRVVRFRDGMWPAGSAYFSVPESFLAEFPAPLLVLPGNDLLHPEGVAKRIAAEAPDARLLDLGYDKPDRGDETVATIVGFLRQHTPS